MGSVVCNDILGNATAVRQSNYQEMIPDLKSQIEQWMDFEKQRLFIPPRRLNDERTTFTGFFGIWDLWHISGLNKGMDEDAVERIILKLFVQLDAVAENSEFPVRIVLPQTVDVALLPGYMRQSQIFRIPTSHKTSTVQCT